MCPESHACEDRSQFSVSPAVKEIGLAACGWVPVLGLGCDGYDIARAAKDGDGIGVGIGIVGLLPFGDILKTARKVDDVSDAARGAGKAASGCSRCFLAGTDVLMADGTTKTIEDIKVGDTVHATDPESGESGPREVTALIITEDDKHFNELDIATDDGVEKLTATHEHPFWSPSKGDWVKAASLKPGMTLLTDSGDTVIVTANRPTASYATAEARGVPFASVQVKP